ncbi:MAG: stkP 2 [Verrucomicrobiales bacterium]|nr:stkP 2 [Verrucomicrobiales bacterium]
MDYNELINAQDKPVTRRFGHFQLDEQINTGGMAEIWVATHEENRKTYALRKLHDSLKFNFLARKRFFRGCDVLEKISGHENIVGHIEHGKIENLPYMLMDYVESSNIKQLISRVDDVLSENVANILIDSATAIEHVHENGFMHLDVKPENFLVTRNGHVRLCDFDLALERPEKPKKFSKNPGTPSYMPPEQLQHQEIDHRVDIFAFGVMAYEMVTFHKPFPGESPDEILRKQLDNMIRPPHEYNQIPADLEKIILKCLERDIDRRYPFMSIVVRDLKDALYL